MRLLVLFLALAVGLSAKSSDAKTHKSASKSVQMEMEFEINGSLVAAPHIVTELGQTATVTQTSGDEILYAIEVTPTQPKAGQVAMSFEISRTINGHKEILSRPKILSLEGEKARVEQKSESGQTTMALEVTAKI